MFIGAVIGFFFGAASGFILFALISAAKESDTFVERHPFEGDNAEDQPESEEEI